MWLKSTNLQFSRCCIFVSFGNSVDFVVHYDNTCSGFPLTPIRMTLNDLERPIHLKARLADRTLDVRMLWLLELTMRDLMNVGLNYRDKNVANEL